MGIEQRIEFDFGEKQRIALQYDVPNKDKLELRGSEWFYDGKPIEEWKQMEDLYSKDEDHWKN